VVDLGKVGGDVGAGMKLLTSRLESVKANPKATRTEGKQRIQVLFDWGQIQTYEAANGERREDHADWKGENGFILWSEETAALPEGKKWGGWGVGGGGGVWGPLWKSYLSGRCRILGGASTSPGGRKLKANFNARENKENLDHKKGIQVDGEQRRLLLETGGHFDKKENPG